MSLNFRPVRLIIFTVCTLVFWFLGGFESTVTSHDGTPVTLGNAWIRCLVMFFVGAVAVSFIDHYIGTLERQNLRLVYLIIGGVLMVGAHLLLKSAKAALVATA